MTNSLTRTKPATVNPSDAASKRAMAFAKTAETMLKNAGKKYDELKTANVNTPKRLREANSKRIDADILADKANYYLAISKAIIGGTLPPILKGIGPVQSENDLAIFVAGYATGGGYYDAYRAMEPPFKLAESDYQQKALLRSSERLGLYTMDQVQEAYEALQAISGVKKPDPAEAKLRQLIDKWRFSKQPGFFPTPEVLGKRVVAEADIRPGDTVYEPSAGLGDLAEIIREQYPNNLLEVGETMFSLREILTLKGFSVVGDDFLLVTARYDKIIMNPPFENNQDIDHVRHAYTLLNPGGRVVSIMGEGAFMGSQKKRTQFLDWLDEVNATQMPLPEGSFKSAFSPTGVRTRLVILDKPGAKSTTNLVTAQARAKPKKAKNATLRAASTKMKAVRTVLATKGKGGSARLKNRLDAAKARIAEHRGIEPQQVKVYLAPDTNRVEERRLKVDAAADKTKRAALQSGNVLSDKKKLTKAQRADIKRKAVQDAESGTGKKKELSPEQVIKLGKRINFNRFHILIDGKVYDLREDVDSPSTNKRRLAPTESNLLQWAKNPGRYDLIGVDAAGKSDVTVHKKRDKKVVPKRLAYAGKSKGLAQKKARKPTATKRKKA